MENARNRAPAVSIARVVGSAFVAVLLAGPSPTGYLGMAFRGQQLTFLIFCAPVVLVLRSLISGVLAGERLGVWAGGLAALWVVHAGFLNYSEYTHESRVISLLMYLVFMYIPLALGALFGWLGGRLAIQYRISWFGSARVCLCRRRWQSSVRGSANGS